MTVWEAAILGVVQGVTEFLPISSDGHLALAHHFLGYAGLDLTFDVFLHGVTLAAIIFFFRYDLLRLSKSEMVAIAIGTVPAVIFGLLVRNSLEAMSASLVFVGGCLAITGLFNLQAARCLSVDKERRSEVTPVQALIIGAFQAFAILPGISRSGGTIASAITQDIDRHTAVRFSFLLGIPAIAGASLLELVDVAKTGFVEVEPLPYLVGGIAAFIVGLASLSLLKLVMENSKLHWFGWYAVAIGLITIGIGLR